MFLELRDDVLSLLLLDLIHKDRLSVALTCQDSLKKVESFSEQKWRELLPMADENFEARIHDQSSIQTENPKPLVLPHRYLLWKAHRTYLYSLDAPRENGEGEIMSLDILPDGTIMSCRTCDHQEVHDVSLKWDLSTKQLISSTQLEKGPNEESTYFVQVCKEFVIVEYFGSIRVFTLDGKLLRNAHTTEGSLIQATAMSEKGVYFVAWRAKTRIFLTFRILT